MEENSKDQKGRDKRQIVRMDCLHRIRVPRSTPPVGGALTKQRFARYFHQYRHGGSEYPVELTVFVLKGQPTMNIVFSGLLASNAGFFTTTVSTVMAFVISAAIFHPVLTFGLATAVVGLGSAATIAAIRAMRVAK